MQLAPTKSFNPKDLREYVEVVNTHFKGFEGYPINFRDVTINDDFTLNIDSPEFKTTGILQTQTSVETLCKKLSIPNPFRSSIPEDLLLHNIRRLLQENETKEVTIINDREDLGERVVGFSTTPVKQLISPVTMFSHLPISDDMKPQFLFVYDGFGVVDWVNSAWPIIEPKVGHPSGLGISLKVDFLTAFATAKTFLMQFICTNGASLPKYFGNIHLYGSSKTESRYERFFDKLNDSFIRIEAVKEAYDFLGKTSMNTDRFRHHWNSTNNVLNDNDVTDRLFSVAPDERKSYFKDVEKSKSEARELLQRDANFEVTPINYYDVYYNITEHAQKIQPLERKELTLVAGKFLADYYRN